MARDDELRKLSIYGLPRGKGNILDALLPVGIITVGGLHFYKPGERAHAGEARHVHADHYEVFVNVQGKGVVEVEGVDHEFRVGDVILIEPGESHHVRSDEKDPLVNLWMGASIRSA